MCLWLQDDAYSGLLMNHSQIQQPFPRNWGDCHFSLARAGETQSTAHLSAAGAPEQTGSESRQHWLFWGCTATQNLSLHTQAAQGDRQALRAFFSLKYYTAVWWAAHSTRNPTRKDGIIHLPQTVSQDGKLLDFLTHSCHLHRYPHIGNLWENSINSVLTNIWDNTIWTKLKIPKVKKMLLLPHAVTTIRSSSPTSGGCQSDTYTLNTQGFQPWAIFTRKVELRGAFCSYPEGESITPKYNTLKMYDIL